MPIIVIVLGPPVVPIDEIQVEPCLMMAALIGWSQAKRLCTMLTRFPKAVRTSGLRNSQTSAHLSEMDPQWWGAGWRRQGTISKCFVNSTEVVFATTSPRCTIEFTCNQVNFFRSHNCAKSENELLDDAFLLDKNVADM